MIDSTEASAPMAERGTNGTQSPTTTKDDSNDEQRREELTELTAKAMSLYSDRKYEEAAEVYSTATELQSDLNGEMAIENADLLFAYGRCLYKLAQKTSTVLGGTAASAQLKGSKEKNIGKKRKANGDVKHESSAVGAPSSASLMPIIETAQPADVMPAEDAQLDSKPSASDTPFFQIEGDAEDWTDSSDEEEADGDEDADEDEEEDDFNTAYEILDMSRLLYLRKLDANTATSVTLDTPQSTQSLSGDSLTTLKFRIFEIYELQAEINLEGERYDAAAADYRSSLKYIADVRPPHDSILATAHYSLSVALEAASQVQQRDKDGNPVGEISIDWNIRNEAVAEQDKAISSQQLRLAREEEALKAIDESKTLERRKQQDEVEEVKEIVAAMKQRLEELKKPPVSVKAEAEKDLEQALMGSVLGQMLGGSKDEQKAKLAEVVASANDLSGMVKRKKPKESLTGGKAPADGVGVLTGTSIPVDNGNGKGKRKIEEVESETINGHIKKVRVEDVND